MSDSDSLRLSPLDAEHRAALRIAVREVKAAAVAWAVGVVIFAIYNGVVYSWDFALMSAITVWLGGETTCALGYLVAERILRPVTARALQVRPAGGRVAPGVRGRLTGAWLLGTGVPLLGVVTVGVAGILGQPVREGVPLGKAGVALADHPVDGPRFDVRVQVRAHRTASSLRRARHRPCADRPRRCSG